MNTLLLALQWLCVLFYPIMSLYIAYRFAHERYWDNNDHTHKKNSTLHVSHKAYII